jgi:hypothetical protein
MVSNIGYNSARTIKATGAYSNPEPEFLYLWDENNDLLSNPQAVLNESADWGREYHKLQNYYLRSQITEH